MLNLTLYSSVIIVHVLAASLLIGGGASGSVLRNFMKGAPSGHELGLWLEFGRRAGRLNPVFALTVLSTGVFLGSAGWWSDTWFACAATLLVMDAVLAVRVIQRSAGALGAALARARGELTPEVLALRDGEAWDRAIAALRANNVTMVYLMFQKPGLDACVGMFALAQAVSFTAYFIGRARKVHRSTSGVAANALVAHA